MPTRTNRMVERGRCHWFLRNAQRGLVALAVAHSLLVRGGTPASAQHGVKPADSPSMDEYVVKLSVLPEYSEGKYGTGHTTQILEVPFRGEWSATDRLDLILTIPYVWMRGRGDTTIVGGRVVPVVGRRPGQVATEDGLGDILLELNYTLLEDKGLAPDLTPFVEIKFPTADASRGLGTGEFRREDRNLRYEEGRAALDYPRRPFVHIRRLAAADRAPERLRLVRRPLVRCHGVVQAVGVRRRRYGRRIGTINATSAGAAGVRPGPGSPRLPRDA
jgi:hypothetical protein